MSDASLSILYVSLLSVISLYSYQPQVVGSVTIINSSQHAIQFTFCKSTGIRSHGSLTSPIDEYLKNLPQDTGCFLFNQGARLGEKFLVKPYNNYSADAMPESFPFLINNGIGIISAS